MVRVLKQAGIKARHVHVSDNLDAFRKAPAEADGNWFHQAIYTYKESGLLPPRELFTTIYRVLIGKDSGPRAGWFLSILPRDWLIDRLRLLK